jgi:dihydrofolate reductase
MGKVSVGLAVSLDGFIAGPDDGNPLPLGAGGDALFEHYEQGDREPARFPGLKMDAVSVEFFDRETADVRAVITGRRTYDISRGWGGDSPVPGTALFVLTHRPPEPAPPGHTFVTDGIESAVAAARSAAGDGDVSLAGSAPVQQALRAGLLDELWVSVVPVLLGGGVSLFGHLGRHIRLEPTTVVQAPGVTHLGYRILH